MKAKFLILILVSLWVGACDSNNMTDGVKLKMKAVTNSSASNARINTSEITFQFVQVGVNEVEFELADEGDDDSDETGDRIEDDDDNDDEDNNSGGGFEGPFVVDLLTGTSTPDFGVANIKPGLYEEVEMELAPVLLDGNSVFIAFTFTAEGSNEVQVQLSTKQRMQLKIESESGFQVDSNALNTILVLLDLQTLLSTVDLSQATADSDGVIRINDTSNVEIKDLLFANFKNACHSGEDDDHDSEIDDEGGDD